MGRIGSLTFGLLLFSATATGGQAIQPEQQVAGCTVLDSTTIDSGVSRATGFLKYCIGDDGYESYRVEGTLWDTACDNRTAYLDFHAEGPSSDPDPVSVGGCGASTGYRAFLASWQPFYGVKLTTRACNLTCSSSASDWLYP